MGLAWTMDHLKLRGTSLDPWWIIGKRFLPILIGLDKFRPSLALMWIWRQKRMNATCDILTTKMHKWPFLGVKLFWFSNHSVQCQIHQKNLGIGQTPPFLAMQRFWELTHRDILPQGIFGPVGDTACSEGSITNDWYLSFQTKESESVNQYLWSILVFFSWQPSVKV